ncbi:hypothetical protein [Pseudonocardia sp. NPDC049154]|uniref:hypothetical protein n=1 Tax=Pseudonocardia sp. NPDC049154 TaxID=3155501 RepID=UPI0033E008BE
MLPLLECHHTMVAPTLPGAELVALRGVGHISMINDPVAVSGAILARGGSRPAPQGGLTVRG